MELPKPVLVASGGLVGAGTRWALLQVADDAAWALVGMNAIGSFVLGMLIHGALRGDGSRRLGVGVGFCGALTTFSTLAVDAAHHLDAGSPLDGAGLLLASVVTGLVALLGGMATRRESA
ncbi:MAG: CrcB family protein [Acidimicrobiales bacterium]